MLTDAQTAAVLLWLDSQTGKEASHARSFIRRQEAEIERLREELASARQLAGLAVASNALAGKPPIGVTAEEWEIITELRRVFA